MNISTSTTINAPASAVWKVLTDFPTWGQWSNFRQVNGAPVAGTKLGLKMPGMSFSPTVTTAETDRQFGWAQTLITRKLFRGEHTFTLTDNGDGTTTFTNEEAFTGLIAKLTGGMFSGAAGQSNGYTVFNARLKARVEQTRIANIARSVR